MGAALGQSPTQPRRRRQAIADALKPSNDHPLVVTLAACDSGTADRPELGNSSLVETLHRNGIPVVVASQFPLTKPGSVTLTKEFYRPLLSGADVRIALHAARVALREEARQVDERRHDWLSLVGYVRLPAEGYSQYLRAFGLRVQLHMLEAARKDAEPLFAQPPPPPDTFDQVEGRLGERIAQLQVQKEGAERRSGQGAAGRVRRTPGERKQEPCGGAFRAGEALSRRRRAASTRSAGRPSGNRSNGTRKSTDGTCRRTGMAFRSSRWRSR